MPASGPIDGDARFIPDDAVGGQDARSSDHSTAFEDPVKRRTIVIYNRTLQPLVLHICQDIEIKSIVQVWMHAQINIGSY